MSESLDIIMVADASGSMLPLVKDTVGGMNQFFEDQKKVPGEVYVTLYTFDSNAIKQRFFAKPMHAVEPLTEDTYYKGHGGWTPLLDAVGLAITDYEKLPLRAPKSMFVIVTDGQENISTEWQLPALREKISAMQNAGTAFIFLGANDSAWQAQSMGVAQGSTGSYAASGAGTATMYKNLSANTTRVRSADPTVSASASAQTMNWTTDEGDGAGDK